MIRDLKLSSKRLKEIEEKITGDLKNHLKQTGCKGFTIGVSGGIDSALVLALAVKTKKKTQALIMPDLVNNPKDVKDAVKLCEKLDVKYDIIKLEPILESIEKSFPWKHQKKKTTAWGNVKARTRMLLNYLAANQKDYLVLGTGNKTELLIGYFTKYGDGGVDILPIGQLYKCQVRQLARHLKVPKRIIDKAPTAGLWAGQTDEVELGLTYDQLDEILYLLTEEWATPLETCKKTKVTQKKIREIIDRIEQNRHKVEPTPIISISG